MFQDNVRQQDEQSKKSGELSLKEPEGASLRAALQEYSEILGSTPPPSSSKVNEYIDRVEKALSSSLGLPPDAKVDLRRVQDPRLGDVLLGSVTMPGSPRELKLSIGLDSVDGSVVVGRGVGTPDARVQASHFQLGVRLSGRDLKESFGKIQEALRVLPPGFDVMGFSQEGSVIAYNGSSGRLVDSNGQASLGEKDGIKGQFRVVTFDEMGRPSVESVPSGVRVEAPLEGGPARLRVTLGERDEIVEPFPPLGSPKRINIDQILESIKPDSGNSPPRSTP